MSGLTRRGSLALLAALGLVPGRSVLAEGAAEVEPGMTLGAPVPFVPDTVKVMARKLAESAHVPPPRVPKGWTDLTYDQYRKIWFDTRNALWRGTDRPAQVEFFPAGLYFPSPVLIHSVADGLSREILWDMAVFDTTDQFPDPPSEGMGYSGFRIHGEIVEKGVFQEYAVFQGASYFRGIGRDHIYGLSARGLALNTASPDGEEFPEFRAFWIEAPEAGATEVIVHALMDSPSVTGAYRFAITKGETTVMDVQATLFPRVDLAQAGIAAGTSMFLFDQTNRNRFDDFRDAVHDSDGLLIANGMGEHIWRPLANPVRLGISAFADAGPRGFGLMQRARALDDFGDLAAHYEKRPSLWVEPAGDWGAGSVMLVEIPADKEIYDNIVAFWRPAAPLAAGQAHDFAYRLHWCATGPAEGTVARVLNSRTGARIFEEGRIFTIDFEPHPALGEDPADVEPVVTTGAGEITSAIVQKNPATGGMRLDFTLVAGDAPYAELRAELLRNSERVSEVWLYRWSTG
jgi:glucans biosynthesis protein